MISRNFFYGCVCCCCRVFREFFLFFGGVGVFLCPVGECLRGASLDAVDWVLGGECFGVEGISGCVFETFVEGLNLPWATLFHAQMSATFQLFYQGFSIRCNLIY